MATVNDKLIHAAVIYEPPFGARRLLLRQKDPLHYVWWLENQSGEEAATEVSAPHIEEALRLAHKRWLRFGFRTFKCGFRYSLPERDEHGMNALFHQMVASYSNSNGVYFDEELGHPCFVQGASMEARNLWQELKKSGRMNYTTI